MGAMYLVYRHPKGIAVRLLRGMTMFKAKRGGVQKFRCTPPRSAYPANRTMGLQHDCRVLHNRHQTKIRDEGHAFVVHEYVGLI